MNRSHYQDAVRYMSVHSGTHRDLAAHRRTQRDNGKTARDAGFPRPRAVCAGGGRCWVRTNVG
jgi:hypothetical protein